MNNYLSDDDRRVWGDDLLSVIDRKSREAVSPELRRLQAENQSLQQRIARGEAHDIYSTLISRSLARRGDSSTSRRAS
jgi:hypothetical protein